MNLSGPFIARPVATVLLTLGVTLVGALAFNLLPVAPLPKIDAPAIFVSASLPGASPEVISDSPASEVPTVILRTVTVESGFTRNT